MQARVASVLSQVNEQYTKKAQELAQQLQFLRERLSEGQLALSQRSATLVRLKQSLQNIQSRTQDDSASCEQFIQTTHAEVMRMRVRFILLPFRLILFSLRCPYFFYFTYEYTFAFQCMVIILGTLIGCYLLSEWPVEHTFLVGCIGPWWDVSLQQDGFALHVVSFWATPISSSIDICQTNQRSGRCWHVWTAFGISIRRLSIILLCS